MTSLTVPVFARLGRTETQIGRLVIEDGTPTVEIDDDLLRLARTVLSVQGLGERDAAP